MDVALILFIECLQNSIYKSVYTPCSFTLTLNFCLNVAWLFTWDREQIVSSCAILVFMAITNVVATGTLATNLSLDNHELLRSQKIYYWYVSNLIMFRNLLKI